MDSVVLTHLLAALAPRYQWTLSALHVHHGISPQADAWADFCRCLCADLGIPLHIEHVDIRPLREMGVEAAARTLRHAALARQSVDFIAFAHHQQDQVETLLLQLLRGAGVKGAAAMPAVRVRDNAPGMLRPLLDVPRESLLAYAQHHQLQWVEDESNADPTYARNYVRHHILPLLQQRFPGSLDTLARSARHFAESAQLLDALAQQDVAVTPTHGLPLAALRQLSALRAKNALRWFLQQQGAPMPHAAQLEDMLRQILTARADAALRIEFGGWCVYRHRDAVYVERSLPPLSAQFQVDWQGESSLSLPQLGGVLHFDPVVGAGISLDMLAHAPVQVRTRRGGEGLRLHAGGPTRPLRKLLQEYDIPAWQRDTLPLLFCGDTCVAAAGIGVNAAFQAAPQQAGVQLRWTRGAAL